MTHQTTFPTHDDQVRSRPRPVKPSNEVLLLAVGVVTSVAIGAVAGRAPGIAIWMVWLLGSCVLYGLRNVGAALTVFAFAYPFEFVFYGWGVGRYNMLAYPAIGLALWWTLTIPRFRRRLFPAEMFYAALIIWIAITVLWSEDKVRGWGAVFTHTGILAVFYIFGRGVADIRTVRRCLWGMVTGVLCLAAVLSFYYQATEYIEMYGRTYFSAFGSAEEVSSYDFGNAALVAVIAALGLWELETTPFARRMALFCAGLLAATIFLTLGRSLVVEFGIAALIWAMAARARYSRELKLVMVAGIGIIGLAAALMINPDAMGARWSLSREAAEEGNLVGLTSGRSLIWSSGIEFFLARPLAGIGAGGFQRGYLEEAGIAKGAHNAFIMLLAETGVFGAVFLAAALIAFGFQAWRVPRWRHLTLAWWIYFVIEANAHGIGRHKAFWIAAGVTAALGQLAARERRRVRRRAPVHPATDRPHPSPFAGRPVAPLPVQRSEG